MPRSSVILFVVAGALAMFAVGLTVGLLLCHRGSAEDGAAGARGLEATLTDD